MGLHDDGKTGGALNSWGQYAKSGDIIFDVAGGGLGGSVVGKVAGRACIWIVSTVTNGLTILILHHPNLIITIIAVRVFLVDNCYNCIWT
jgi:hypothetical protein